MLEMRFHGRGGQGVVTLAELLAKTALKAGKQAQTMPFFGVERRGAAVKASVRLSDVPIKERSQSYEPSVLVLMNENLLPIALSDGPHNGAYLIVNSANPIATAKDQWHIDAAGTAIKYGLVTGGEPFLNIPMLGALCRVIGLPEDKMVQAISDHWSEELAAPNIAAAQEAYKAVAFVKGGGIK